MFPQAIGYASSIVLVVTIASQLGRQWRSGHSKGVSPFLFVGQLAASIGFTTYASLVNDPIFVITNAVIAVTALVGIGMMIYHRTQHLGSQRWSSNR